MTFLINVFLGLSTLFCVGMNDPAKNPGEFQNYVLNQLNPDCYYNWAIYSEDNLKNPKFDPMLWTVSTGAINQAVNYAKVYKGRTWLIYNEPEGLDQANTDPKVAASWFDKAYEAIKAVDSTATIACCGVMIRTEGINWLDTFIKNVKHKPDVWHVHVYTPKATFESWKQYVDYWWYWNNQFGGNKETFITETCAMYEPSQEDLLISILGYQHSLLKRVYWFSAYHEPIVDSWYCNLMNEYGDPVGLGSVFQYRNVYLPSSKLTPQPEPTKKPTEVPEVTKTPEPTKTPQPTPTKTPTPTITPTATIDPGETTNLPNDDEPTIYVYQIFMPIVTK